MILEAIGAACLVVVLVAAVRWWLLPDGAGHLLCGECTLIFPSGDQRKSGEGERCEVCGKVGS